MITATRLRSVLVGTALLLGLSVVPAQAAIADQWGFAYNENPAPAAVFTLMDPAHQWSKNGGANAEVRGLGVGRYEVRFARTANKVGIPHVTTVSEEPRYCQVVKWWPDFADGYEYVRVNCFRHGGFLDNTRFTVMFTGSDGKFPGTSDKHAYIASDDAGNVLDSYNSQGDPNFVGKGGSGEYKVRLELDGPASESGNFQVTAVGSRPARCKVAEWHPDLLGHTLIVHCFDHNSKPADQAWTLSYNRERPVIGEFGPPKRFGYMWVTPALPPLTNFNSVGALNTVTFGSGQYYVIFPKIGLPEDHAQVTAFGKGPEYCGLQTLWVDWLDDAHVRNVICFDDLGALAKTESFVAFTSRH
jgi:hypothetical protein